MRMRKIDANARRKLEKMAANGALFEAAVSAVLRGWPALKMAVSNQFGGPQSQAKAAWMETATTQWMKENGPSLPLYPHFLKSPYTCSVFAEGIQPDELVSFLETLLDQEFDTIVEDSSTPDVSHTKQHFYVLDIGFCVCVQVSRKICDLYRNCCNGREEIVRTFLSSQPLPPPLSPNPPPHHCEGVRMEEGEGVRVEESASVRVEEMGSDDVTMEEEGEDEQGWTVVKKSRRRSKQ